MTERVDGVVLRRTPLKEISCVCTAYTKELGLISFVTPRSNRSARATIQPYARLELILNRSPNHDLFRLVDYSLIDDYMDLRQSLVHLRQSATCAQALLQSQMPGKPSHPLFTAFCRHLERIGKAKQPQRIGLQFLIKLLKHEGLLEAAHICAECQNPLGSASPSRSGMLCQLCAGTHALMFDMDEYAELRTLFESRQVLEGEVSPLFSKKVKEIFTQKIQE